MQIKDLFVNNIERYIDPVIKMGDDKNILQELEEFVVTEKIEENILKFFDNYNETALKEKENIGVWITGFFGSGKSHFAKVIGYLLENKKIRERTAIEIFSDRLKGLENEMEIKSYLHVASTTMSPHVVMFQIEAEHDQLDEKKSIAKIVYRQFLRHQGLSDDLHIAELEKELIAQGKYDEFKVKIKEISGKDWKEVRESKLFSKRPIAEVLHSISPEHFESVEKAEIAFNELEKRITLEISELSKDIMKYISYLEKEKGEVSPHIVFIIDEVSQYIGESDDLLLELQSIVEKFGEIGRGRIWLIVTAQEKLEEVIEGVMRKKDDYRKIMDRFETILPLTSENIVKVLKERILKKKEEAATRITELYSKYTGTITYTSKMEGTARTMSTCEEENFITSYPFLPYQLEINQQIFTNIRIEAGHSRKLTGTERSMLGVTQGILKSPETSFKESELGRLVTYDEIFDQIAVEIPSKALRDINSVKLDINGDKKIAQKTIKTLYMLQKLKWVPKTSRNVAKAMVGSVDSDVATFERKIEKTLNELVAAKYAIFENGQYEYISGSKKLIEEEISKEPIKKHEIKRFVKDQLQRIFDTKRVNYKGIKYFDVKIIGDEDEFSSKGEIRLKVYSPVYQEYGNVERDQVIGESHKNTETLYWLPDPKEKLSANIERYLRNFKVVERRDKNPSKSSEEIALLREKKEFLGKLEENIEKTLKKTLLNGIIIYDGSDNILINRSDIKAVLADEIGKIVPFIYTKFDLAKYKVSETSIKAILNSKDLELHQIEKNFNLFDKKGYINLHSGVVSEIWNKIKQDQERGDNLPGKDLLDYFEKVPYGWDVILVRVVTTALFRAGNIYLRYNGRDFVDYKKKDAQELLSKSNKFNNTYLCYEEEETISLEDRQEVQQKLNVIFDVKVGDTINVLYDAIGKQLSKMVENFEKQKIFWEQHNFKLKDLFYKTPEVCSKILEQERLSKCLNIFLENIEDIQMAYEYQSKIQGFIESDDSKILHKMNVLPTSININAVLIDEKLLKDYKEHIKEIKTVVENNEIIEKWSTVLFNYNKAVEKYREVYEKMHNRRFDVYSNMKAEIEGDPHLAPVITDETFNLIKNFFCKDLNWESKTLRCKTCNFSLSELDSQILAVDKRKGMIISRLLPKPDKEEKQISINLHSVSKKTIIKNEEDLDEAVGNIRREVKEHLDKGETIILE